jgi:hypothetical protein
LEKSNIGEEDAKEFQELTRDENEFEQLDDPIQSCSFRDGDVGGRLQFLFVEILEVSFQVRRQLLILWLD